jgi:hypothetical protein
MPFDSLPVERPLSLPVARKLPFRFRPNQATSRTADFGSVSPQAERSRVAQIFLLALFINKRFNKQTKVIASTENR